MPVHKNGAILESLVAWEIHAGPKRRDQWVDGRSAKESARAWLSAGPGNLPEEVASVLAQHHAFGPVQTWDAEPEVKLKFDQFPGETRNSDLVVYAQDPNGWFLIGVEAKADESFAETIGETLCAALERKLENSCSNGLARVEQLARALFGPRQRGDPSVKHIRYQLMTACAGVLCEAERKGCDRALMLVHEFATSKTRDDKHARNAQELDRFVAHVSHGAVTTLRAGEIVGPFAIPGAPLTTATLALFVGKVSRSLRGSSGA